MASRACADLVDAEGRRYFGCPCGSARVKRHGVLRDAFADVARALLDAGADVSLQNQEGATALHFAASYGHDALVRTLLDAGADAQAVDHKGRTPSAAASAQGHQRIAERLATT